MGESLNRLLQELRVAAAVAKRFPPDERDPRLSWEYYRSVWACEQIIERWRKS